MPLHVVQKVRNDTVPEEPCMNNYLTIERSTNNLYIAVTWSENIRAFANIFATGSWNLRRSI